MEPTRPDRAARPIQVLVVDADRRVRQSLCGLIDLADGMEIAGSASDVAGALAGLAEQPVDLVLLDPRLPEFDTGKALVRRIGSDWPATRVVALCWPEDPVSIDARRLLVLPATVGPDALVELLRSCATGVGPEGVAGLS